MVFGHVDIDLGEIWLTVEALIRYPLCVFGLVVNQVLNVRPVIAPVLVVPLSSFELVEGPIMIVVRLV